MLDDARRISELERRFQSLLSYATVAEVDYDKARLRVRFAAAHVSAWLPWLTPRAAGNEQVWDAPEIGEKVIVLAPNGALESACILPALFSPQSPSPEVSPDIIARHHGDGAADRYDRAMHRRAILLPDDGELSVTIGTTVLTLTGESATLEAEAINVIASGAIKLEGGSILLKSDSIDFGDEGGEPVARKGDPVVGGKIDAGSDKVRST